MRQIEMQSRGRRGDRARVARVDGLVAVTVDVLGRSRNVRRQRNFPVALEVGVEGHAGSDAQAEEATVAFEHRRGRAAGQLDVRAGPGWMAGAKLQPGLVGRDDALQQEFDSTTAGLAAEQARVDDARVVEHKHVAGVEQVRQGGEAEIVEVGTGYVQQATRRPFGDGSQRDEIRRQIEVEVGEVEDSIGHRGNRTAQHAACSMDGAFGAAGDLADNADFAVHRQRRWRYCTMRCCQHPRPGWRNW